MNKLLTTLLVIVSLVAVLTAQSGLQAAASTLCNQVKGLLGVAMFMMVILAAVVYAIGQIMGAETRARATVWATAMFTGSIVAGIILLVVPIVLQSLLPSDIYEGLSCGEPAS